MCTGISLENQAPQGFAVRKNLPPPDRTSPDAPWLDPLTSALLALPGWVVIRLQRRGLLSVVEQARYEAALAGWVPPSVPLHLGSRWRVAAPADQGEVEA